MGKHTVSRWVNDGKTISYHDKLNPGPERTAYDIARHEKMRLRNVRYGYFRVAKEAIAHPICNRCGREILGQMLVVEGVTTHYGACPK